MIRFIYIGDQLEDGDDVRRAFAFFCTITDRFLVISDEQVFSTLRHLQDCLHFHEGVNLPRSDEYLVAMATDNLRHRI